MGKDGKPGFGATAVAVGGTAALGYSPTLRPLSNAMLALVFLALIAANVRANNNPFRRISAFVTNPGGSTQ